MAVNPRPLAPTPLSALATGQQAIVCRLRGGREFCSRMASLGFNAGAPLAVRQNRGRGPIIVALRGALVALGRGEAAHVLVQPEGE